MGPTHPGATSEAVFDLLVVRNRTPNVTMVALGSRADPLALG